MWRDRKKQPGSFFWLRGTCILIDDLHLIIVLCNNSSWKRHTPHHLFVFLNGNVVRWKSKQGNGTATCSFDQTETHWWGGITQGLGGRAGTHGPTSRSDDCSDDSHPAAALVLGVFQCTRLCFENLRLRHTSGNSPSNWFLGSIYCCISPLFPFSIDSLYCWAPWNGSRIYIILTSKSIWILLLKKQSLPCVVCATHIDGAEE